MSAYKIRLYQQRDAEEMHAAALESVVEVYPWMAWCHERYSLDEARQWMAVQEELANQGMAMNLPVFTGICTGPSIHAARSDRRRSAVAFGL